MVAVFLLPLRAVLGFGPQGRSLKVTEIAPFYHQCVFLFFFLLFDDERLSILRASYHSRVFFFCYSSSLMILCPQACRECDD